MPTSITIKDVDVVVFTYKEARARGHSRRRIERYLATNGWRRLRKGVYATVPTEPLFPEDDHLIHLTGALLTAGPGWHASSWSALVAHRLPIISHPLRQVHLTRHAETLTWHKSAATIKIERPWTSGNGEPQLAWPRSITTGIPAVGVCDALCEFAREARFYSAIAAADAALHRALITAEELNAAAQSATGRGVSCIRAMAAFADGRAESPAESRLRVLVDEMGLVAIPQYSIHDGEGPEIFRADLFVCLPETGIDPGPGPHGLLLEFDGRQKFETRPVPCGSRGKSSWTEFDRQTSRDRSLTERGYRVMHVTWQDFDNPALLKNQIMNRLHSQV